MRHRRALAGGACLATGAAAVGGYHEEGTYRAALFWGRVGPAYLHYQIADWRTRGCPDSERQAVFERLHDRYAPVAEYIVLRLRGFFIKIAQIASTRDDFVPPQYLTFFKSCQANAPPEFTPTEAIAAVERSLGRPLMDVFRQFDPDPVGCATIGQVHRAVRHDGREVAVKVQAPHAEQGFRSDLGLIINFCRLAMPQHVSPLREFEKQFTAEFDYRIEARQLEEVAANIMPFWGHRVVIPRPHLDLCTKNVLVMDFLHGRTLITGIREAFRPLAAAQGKTLAEFEAEQRGRPVPSDLRMRWYRGTIRAHDALRNALTWSYNVTVGRAAGQVPYCHSPLPLNISAIINVLIGVHAHQMFFDGAFNADPHPGNVLLLPDGRLGLIDYGQVGRLTRQQRLNYAQLVTAVAAGDKDRAVRISRDVFGYRTERNDDEVAWRSFVFHNDRDWETEGMNPLQYMDWLDRQDPVRHVPAELVLVGRLNLMLRGLANAFGIRLSLAQRYRPYADAVVRCPDATGAEYCRLVPPV